MSDFKREWITIWELVPGFLLTVRLAERSVPKEIDPFSVLLKSY